MTGMAIIQLLLLPCLFVVARLHDLKKVDLRQTRSVSSQSGPKTDVIKHLHDDNLVFKNSYKELETYAELSDDPKASLPSTFTICSAAMRSRGTDQVFFSLLGRDGEPFVGALMHSTHTEDKRSFFYYLIKDNAFSPNMTIPIVFPFEWTHSCLALSTESGLVRWVVDGYIIEDIAQDILKEASEDIPSDLSGKILLGADYGPQGWLTNC